MINKALVLGISFLAPLCALPVIADEAEDGLKEKTVMITVQFSRGRPVEYGTGVVLCQEDDRAWILTANHVFAGKSVEPWKQIRLSQIESATIAFYRNAPPPIKADTNMLRKEMGFYTFKPEDLLLLSVPLTQKLPSTATLSPPPSDADDQNISANGYWKDRGVTWAHVAGELAASRSGSTKFLYHTGEVHEGFSGGPLFNQLGELIGINIQRVPGEQTPDGGAGEWFGKAQVINNQEVMSVIDKWMPAKCLESASQLSELAFYIYEKAMRAVSIRRWGEAEELLRQALAQKSLEGGSVHLEGMRYTRYLPHYHLGLSLFHQGKYSDAIREFDRSDAQAVIHEDKRYKTLKKRRLRAYEELRRQAIAAAAPVAQEKDQVAEQPAAVKPAPKSKPEPVPAAAPEPAAPTPAPVAQPQAASNVPTPAPVAEAQARDASMRAVMREPETEPAVAPAPMSASGPDTVSGEAFTPTHIISTDALRVRFKPDSDAGIRGVLYAGHEVQLLNSNGEWSRVTYYDSDGDIHKGWVASRFLAIAH